MNTEREFATVVLILSSDAVTRGVDAFALSLIKAERQVRKLFTYLVFQFPRFSANDVQSLRAALYANDKVYFKGFLRGFNALYERSIQEIIGADYEILKTSLENAIEFRNKIFHGQLTGQELSTEDLVDLSGSIRTWCTKLANGAIAEIGYDGFGRDSFRKSSLPDLSKRYKVQLTCVTDYSEFIHTYMER